MSREANEERDIGGQGADAAWLAHLAHDLRGPLSPLAMAVSLLQTGRAGPAQQPELYALMQRQIECLTQLLDDTADLLVLRARPAQAVDLVSLLDMLKVKFARQLRTAEVTLAVTVPDVPLPVEGEMRDLLRLVGELLLRCAGIGGAGSVIRLAVVAADPSPQLILQLSADDPPADAAARCDKIVALLTGPTQTHVADAMAATVLRRYGIALTACADAPGFGLQFRRA